MSPSYYVTRSGCTSRLPQRMRESAMLAADQSESESAHVSEPLSLDKAMECEYAAQWREAADAEYNALVMAHGCWSAVLTTCVCCRTAGSSK